MEKLLLTPEDAARVLSIGRSKLYELLASGTLPSVHIGACRRVHIDALEAFAASLGAGAGDLAVTVVDDAPRVSGASDEGAQHAPRLTRHGAGDGDMPITS